MKDYNNIGYTYFRLERYKEAEQNLLKGLAISHDDGSLNESLSELYIGQGKLNLALPYAVTAYNAAYKRKEDRRIQYRKQLILEALEINEIEDKEAKKVKPEVLKKDVTSKNTSSNNHSPYVVSLIIILVISNLFFGVIWLRNRSN